MRSIDLKGGVSDLEEAHRSRREFPKLLLVFTTGHEVEGVDHERDVRRINRADDLPCVGDEIDVGPPGERLEHQRDPVTSGLLSQDADLVNRPRPGCVSVGVGVGHHEDGPGPHLRHHVQLTPEPVTDSRELGIRDALDPAERLGQLDTQRGIGAPRRTGSGRLSAGPHLIVAELDSVESRGGDRADLLGQGPPSDTVAIDVLTPPPRP